MSQTFNAMNITYDTTKNQIKSCFIVANPKSSNNEFYKVTRADSGIYTSNQLNESEYRSEVDKTEQPTSLSTTRVNSVGDDVTDGDQVTQLESGGLFSKSFGVGKSLDP